jgi:hypothetical protein
VFGWLWDFQIIDKGTIGAQVWVQGRLTIRNPKTLEPLIVREQFGGADIKFKKGTKAPLDYANDLKASATDALKKCASELGSAPDIYGKNEFKEIGAKATPLVPPKAPEPPVKDGGYDCHECGALITKAEADYSKKIFKKPLCRKCQPDAKKR